MKVRVLGIARGAVVNGGAVDGEVEVVIGQVVIDEARIEVAGVAEVQAVIDNAGVSTSGLR